MGNKKLKIYQEDAKLRQTTHWDLDYMTSAEIDAFFSVQQSQKTQAPSNATHDNSKPACKSDSRTQGSWQSQQSYGKSMIAALLRPLKGFADLLQGKARMYSINR
jgi:hypothetical protein